MTVAELARVVREYLLKSDDCMIRTPYWNMLKSCQERKTLLRCLERIEADEREKKHG